MRSVPSEPAAHGEAAAACGAWPDLSKACGRKNRAGCSWLGVDPARPTNAEGLRRRHSGHGRSKLPRLYCRTWPTNIRTVR
eukprot:2206675-Prymnesium_polylepis.1